MHGIMGTKRAARKVSAGQRRRAKVRAERIKREQARADAALSQALARLAGTGGGR